MTSIPPDVVLKFLMQQNSINIYICIMCCTDCMKDIKNDPKYKNKQKSYIENINFFFMKLLKIF